MIKPTRKHYVINKRGRIVDILQGKENIERAFADKLLVVYGTKMETIARYNYECSRTDNNKLWSY